MKNQRTGVLFFLLLATNFESKMFRDLGEFDFDCNFDGLSPPKQSKQQNNLVPNLNETEYNKHLKTNNHRQPPNRSPHKNRIVIKRKFGGPAGLLPEIENVNIEPALLEQDVAPSQSILNLDMVSSQMSTNIFHEPPWRRMCEEFSTIPGQFLPNIYNIAWIEAEANAKKLENQKAPFLAAVISNIEVSSFHYYVSLTLKDPTGEIRAYIMSDLYKEYSSDLTINSVIVLKQVGVITAERRKHYLNITAKNLVTIYSKQIDNQEDGNDMAENRVTVKTISIQKIPNQSQELQPPIRNNFFNDSNDFDNFVEDDVLLNVSLKYEEMTSSPQESKISIPSNIEKENVSRKENSIVELKQNQMPSTPHGSDITILNGIEKKNINREEMSTVQFKRKQISPDVASTVGKKPNSIFENLKKFKFVPRNKEPKPMFNFSEEDTSRSKTTTEFNKIFGENSTDLSQNTKSVDKNVKGSFMDLENSQIRSTPVLNEAISENSPSIINSQSSFIIGGSQIIVETKNKTILEDAFSGVDVDSLFDDF